MSRKVDILAPQAPAGQSALMVNRWLKALGDSMVVNEPIAELIGNQIMIYVHAPDDGVLSTITAQPGQNVLSGMLLGQISVIAKNEIEWDNFDQVTQILEDFADQSKDARQRKDANEALGQLLGVTDNPVFLNMNIEQQNKFLQNIIDEQQSGGLSSAAVAQKLLEGLYLRMPANAPRGPIGPGLGLRGPAGPGMGGGGGVSYHGASPMQQQGYAPPPGAMPNLYPQASYPAGVFPPQIPQQQVPYMPPADDEDEKK